MDPPGDILIDVARAQAGGSRGIRPGADGKMELVECVPGLIKDLIGAIIVMRFRWLDGMLKKQQEVWRTRREGLEVNWHVDFDGSRAGSIRSSFGR